MAKGRTVDLHMSPYRYKMLNALDFYTFAKEEISKAQNVDWISDEVQDISDDEIPLIKGVSSAYAAGHIFDSRVDKGFGRGDDKYLRLLQHFKGWFIETRDPVFDPHKFTMMDYRLKWQQSTSFSYVLPTSEHTALVEYTLFTSELIPDEMYDKLLDRYISGILGIDEYTVRKVEKGVIPMTNYPFHKASSRHITKIGTAGSWVKPSSGYSFKNAERNSSRIIENLKHGRRTENGILSPKFRYYDTLLLDILTNHNDMGEAIFAFMYQRNSIQKVFSFLDEETNIIQDLSIMSTFNPLPFVSAMFNQLGSQIFTR
jgi:lycopene beta-cyclase